MHFAATQHDLSRARHDLRTVVNHLEGYVTLLSEGDEAWVLQPEAGALLAAIKNSARVIMHLLEPRLAVTSADAAMDGTGVLRSELRSVCTQLEAALGALQGMPPAQNHPDVARLLTAGARLRSFVDTGTMQGAGSVATGKGPSETAEVRAPSLLVLDEDQSNRDLITRMFGRIGYHVIGVGSCMQILHYAKETHPDVVLLDLLLPDTEGLQLLKQLREILPVVPVIIISALVEVGNVQRCMEAGAEDFIAKPFMPVLLRARVAAALDRKRYRQFLAREPSSCT